MTTSMGTSRAGRPRDTALPSPAWLFAGGTIAVLAAIFLFVYPPVGSGAVTLITGICLMIGGIAVVVGVLAGREERGTLGGILLGGALTIAGFLLATNLLEGTATLTAVLIAWLLVDGLIGTVSSLVTRAPGWPVMLFGSLLGLLLGVLLWADWPTSATWVLAVYAGLVLLFRGMQLIAAGFVLRQLRRG